MTLYEPRLTGNIQFAHLKSFKTIAVCAIRKKSQQQQNMK